MVQFNRGSLHASRSRAIRSGLNGLMRFLVMSAVIPFVFMIRHYVVNENHHSQKKHDNNNQTSSSFTRGGGSSNNDDDKIIDARDLWKDTTRYDARLFRLLQSVERRGGVLFQDDTHDPRNNNDFGDVVELHYCDLPPLPSRHLSKMPAQAVFWLNFTAWAAPVLNTTLAAAWQQPGPKQYRNNINNENASNKDKSNKQNPKGNNNDNPLVFYNKPMEEEFLLQLLEIYAQDQQMCNYTNYRPTIPTTTNSKAATTSLSSKLISSSSTLSTGANELQKHLLKLPKLTGTAQKQRLVFVIFAFADIEQLKRLVQALQMPQHVFIIHLEQSRCSTAQQQQYFDFEPAVRRWAADQPNVQILQFGTILHGTSTVSQTHWRILNWLWRDAAFTDFEFVVSLDGASFPLWDAAKLYQMLMTTAQDQGKHDKSTKGAAKQQPQHSIMSKVWLGPMLHKGKAVGTTLSTANGNNHEDDDDSQVNLLRQKRLLYTTTATEQKKMLALFSAARASIGGGSTNNNNNNNNNKGGAAVVGKLTQRLPRSLLAQQTISEKIAKALGKGKTHSGNTAVYHKSVVQALVESPDVRELFAISKYAANCCLEEWTWHAALSLALSTTTTKTNEAPKSAVFQAYGGQTPNVCESSKKNAVLTQNTSFCYKVEDAAIVEHYTTKSNNNKQPPMLQFNQSANGYYMTNGNRTLELLRQAKELGVLFARKFASDNRNSMELLRQIQTTLF